MSLGKVKHARNVAIKNDESDCISLSFLKSHPPKKLYLTSSSLSFRKKIIPGMKVETTSFHLITGIFIHLNALSGTSIKEFNI